MRMADIVSLSKARTARTRDDKERRAAENRARFGRTKAEKERETAERERAALAAEAHKRDRD